MNELQENLLRRATIGDLIKRSAEKFGNRIALLSGGEKVSFRTFNEKSCQAANAFLELGVKKGDRVAFFTHNCLNYIYCRMGLAKIGAVPVPLNFMLRGAEITFIINDSEPKMLLVEDALIPEVLAVKESLSGVEQFGWFDFKNSVEKQQEWLDIDSFFSGKYPTTEPEVLIHSDDMATLMYTTGTESFPKGVVTSHLAYYMSMMHLSCDCNFRDDDTIIIDIPMFHIAGTTILLGAMTFGAKAIIEYAPDPMVTLKRTASDKITMWVYPPTLYQALPTVPGIESFDLSSLRKCISFGAVLQPVILEKWKKLKPDIEWRNYWGQTESSPLGTTSIPQDFESKINSIGLPDTTITLKVFDENDQELPTGKVGELVMRGPSIMINYWKNEEKTDETLAGGWLHTGDLGYIDEDGYVYFVDRKKDMIKSGGENVSSQEVEGVLLRHEKIAQVAVIGLPDDYWIEAVSAFVMLNPGADATEDELISYCKQDLAGYKVPKKVRFVDSFPMSANGKLLKRKLKDNYLQAHSN